MGSSLPDKLWSFWNLLQGKNDLCFCIWTLFRSCRGRIPGQRSQCLAALSKLKYLIPIPAPQFFPHWLRIWRRELWVAGSFAISARRGKWSHQCEVFFPLNAFRVEGIRYLSFAQCSEDPLLSGTPLFSPAPETSLKVVLCAMGVTWPMSGSLQTLAVGHTVDTGRAVGPTQGFLGSGRVPVLSQVDLPSGCLLTQLPFT